MNYAVILAGGTGKRMGHQIPKQFLNIGDKPILIHTIDVFNRNKNIDVIVVTCLLEWIDKAEELIRYYFPENKKIKIIEGGDNRIQSTINGCGFIIKNYITTDDDIVLTHDSVRPFINDEIINNNIEMCKMHGAVTTGVKTIDTILLSMDSNKVDDVPNRNLMFNVQTPQTFRINELFDILLKVERQEMFTDLCGVYNFYGKDVYLTEGNYNNFKITTIKDLEDANNILK